MELFSLDSKIQLPIYITKSYITAKISYETFKKFGTILIYSNPLYIVIKKQNIPVSEVDEQTYKARDAHFWPPLRQTFSTQKWDSIWLPWRHFTTTNLKEELKMLEYTLSDQNIRAVFLVSIAYQTIAK